MVDQLHTGSIGKQKSTSSSKTKVHCLWQLNQDDSNTSCFWNKTKCCQEMPKKTDPRAWPPVSTNMLRQKMACTKQSKEKKYYSSHFTDKECGACGRSCLLLLTVSAVEAAAFSSQTKCRMALCHRHLLNDFLRQGQKRNPVRWSPKPLP